MHPALQAHDEAHVEAQVVLNYTEQPIVTLFCEEQAINIERLDASTAEQA